MALISVAEKKHYCIDKTEVTQSQYAKFVDAAGDDLSLVAGISGCSFQKSFEVLVNPNYGPDADTAPTAVRRANTTRPPSRINRRAA